MSRLPQELIDLIIDYVNCVCVYADKRMRKACSLVCNQWSTRSRKYLFARVELESGKDLKRWCACIRPGPSGRSSLVKDLSLLDPGLSMSCSGRRNRVQLLILSDAIPHLQSFSGLQALEIIGWNIPVVQGSLVTRYVGPPTRHVTRLKLRRILAHPLTLATYLSHFPRLNHLSISDIRSPFPRRNGTDDSHRESCGSIVPTHPCGELSVDSVSSFSAPMEIFEAIALLEPRFCQVSIMYIEYDGWRDFWPLVEACAGPLEELGILADEYRECARFKN